MTTTLSGLNDNLPMPAGNFPRFADFYPLHSFLGDWVMWKDMLTGKIRL